MLKGQFSEKLIPDESCIMGVSNDGKPHRFCVGNEQGEILPKFLMGQRTLSTYLEPASCLYLLDATCYLLQPARCYLLDASCLMPATCCLPTHTVRPPLFRVRRS